MGGGDGGVVVVDGAEAVDNFGGSLKAPEKWRNEDPMDREVDTGPLCPELPTPRKSPILSILG